MPRSPAWRCRIVVARLNPTFIFLAHELKGCYLIFISSKGIYLLSFFLIQALGSQKNRFLNPESQVYIISERTMSPQKEQLIVMHAVHEEI